MISYGRQKITDEDILAVTKVLRSDYITQGPVGPVFENEVSSYVHAKYAVATNSATSALHIACLALNLGKGDIVWTTPNTFVATANCALYCGASVDFIDIDLDTYNISIKKLEDKLAEASVLGKLPKILIPVHFAGQSADMFTIKLLSEKYGFKIIEDASHGIGGSYRGEKVGCCRHSDITIFSFHPVKIITTGEGGMAVTNDLNLADKMRLFRSHGITSNKHLMSDNFESEIWNYQQIGLGYNYRMTDIQSALGISQLRSIDDNVTTRHHIAKIYNSKLTHDDIKIPFQSPMTHSSYHLYPLMINFDNLRITQKEFINNLLSNDIGVNLHYIPVYLHPYYQKLGFSRGYCPNSEYYFRHALSIPMHPSLSMADVDKVINEIMGNLTKCQ